MLKWTLLAHDGGQAPASAGERRETGRKGVARAAVLLLPGDQGGVPCVVLNLCANGARLEVEPHLPLPERFDLAIHSEGLIVPCRLGWRQGSAAGVQFLEAGATPAG